MSIALGPAPWRGHQAQMLAHRQGVRRNRLEQLPTDESFYDDREGHCWCCSHLTHHEDRTCDFCLIEIVGK